MAAARRPNPSTGRRVAVATSGGRDSTALLHAVARQGEALGLSVVALHVHHGLQPAADGWLDHVRRQARRLGVRFAFERLVGQPAPGDSVEAWARKHRYQALARLARAEGCSLVLLAQHRRDQAETFLIQALRGGGAAGLAAMPRIVEREGLTWVRPWLGCSRESIEAYVRRHRLRFIDDPSNGDPRFARGRLRALWPALESAFGDAELTLSRAAQRAAADAAVVAEVAEADLATMWGLVAAGGAEGAETADVAGKSIARAHGSKAGNDPAGAIGRENGDGRAALPVAAWLQLSPARRASALRRWLVATLPAPVPETLVRRLCDELPGCDRARWPAGEGDLVLARGFLAYGAAAPRRPAGPGRGAGSSSRSA